jgi:putative ABC transport system permease protein
MLINNIKITLRRLGRQKLTTSLHVIGLTLGMAVCMLIGLYLRHEQTYDSHHAKADRTYRLNSQWTDAGEKSWHWATPTPLTDALRSDLPGLENVVRVVQNSIPIIEINKEKRFKQENVMLTEPEFLDVFDVEVLEGNAYETLRKPFHALLTESTAEKFFGRESALGKTFKYNNDFTITVGGIIRDFPANTHLGASMLVTFHKDEKFLKDGFDGWTYVNGTSAYVVLPDGKEPESLAAGLKSIADAKINSSGGMPKDSRWDFNVQRLDHIHFEDKYSGGSKWVEAVSTTWLWFFGIIGLAVLTLACINFVNLSTAQAMNRAKEVGVRKAIGAGKGQLIRQFLGEALMLASISGVVSVLIAKLSLPSLNLFLEKNISFHALESPGVLGALLLGIVVTSLLAGLYPAWVIARVQAVNSLKAGWSAGNKSSAGLRRGLVVAQFSLSVGLLIALMLIGEQMDFLRSKNLGFDKENTVMIESPGGANNTVFSAELSRIPEVKAVSYSTSPPSSDGHWGTIMSHTDENDPNRKEVNTIMTDEHFCQFYGLELKAGRFLEAKDTNAISESLPEGQRFAKSVVNETLVKAMGYASNEAALGQRFFIGMNGWHAEITGVVSDFNASSLHESVKPTLITQYLPWAETTNIKLKPGEASAALSALESAYKQAYPTEVFAFVFLDQKIDAFYKSEARLFFLFKIFAGLAMLISCLGLWGLATFAAQQRTKEIGVRKVLGASVQGIVAMLSREFLSLVILSLVIAVPLAYFGMNKWLQDFAFRIDIHWTVFALAGLVAVVVAFLTVSFQSIKAALANPVKSLRNE